MNTPTRKEPLESAQLLQLVLDTIPQKVFWKDINSKYLGCNQLFAIAAGLSSPDQIVDKTDFDLSWTEEEARFYRECDRRVMDRNEPEIGIIESQHNNNGEKTFLETNKVPLLDDNGQVIGILGSYHDITRIKEAEQTLQQAHDLLEQRVNDRTSELQHLAQHDALTGLPNRSFFMSQLENVVTNGLPFGLLFVDVDRFKTVNDSLGHGAGDKLLIEVARILERATRDSDTVGRFGGDEFTVLLRGVRSENEVAQISERIQKMLAESVELERFQHIISASIGCVIDLKNVYKSAGDILRDSDIAMFEAKRAGKACFKMFSPDMLMEVSEKITLEQKIRQGLSNNEFFNAYQPIINLRSGRLAGFEALVRWRNKTRGLMPPCDFLPLAEETGLIIEIGEQVVRQACDQLCHWRNEYPDLTRNMSISVNVSIVQLLWEDFPVFLESILATYGLTPVDINIEITESMILDKQEDVKEVVEKLSNRGHKMMLDDFGTGYSSLSYLHKFPIDTLKIDRSFIEGVDENHYSQAIVKTVLGLAELLDMQVIAEGVETANHEECIMNMGCTFVQGYRYAKPMDRNEAEEYLATYTMTLQGSVADTDYYR